LSSTHRRKTPDFFFSFFFFSVVSSNLTRPPEGTGNSTSQSACKYSSTDTSFNNVCPTACVALLKATWGDCYCADPLYQPSVSNPFIAGLTVQQIYEVLAGSFAGLPGANCRTWLQQPTQQASWRCL
jgi:hypothetical protein